MSAVVTIDNLGKRYTLGRVHPNYLTLREAVGDLLLAPLRRRAAPGGQGVEFWALRDLSLRVEEGETIGIVGSNGAGKSTLLKILCRITKPTTGRARIEGRIGSLLEVGTGFHPDLTGRENVYLNGSILGMTRAEINRKFDEIVEFSEIGAHLDTAVKFYSSGMYVRLAFSVAAHLEPEILIMDEVLAVGDAAFQRKCLDKMASIRRDGRTIFFVSHNAAALTRLCRRAIHLRDGRLVADGAAAEVVARYMKAAAGTVSARVWEDARAAPGDAAARLRAVRLLDAEGAPRASFEQPEPVCVEIVYDVLPSAPAVAPRVEITGEDGTLIFGGRGRFAEQAGAHASVAQVPGDLLAANRYRVHVQLESAAAVHAQARDALLFEIADGRAEDASGDTFAAAHGLIRSPLRWTDRAHTTEATEIGGSRSRVGAG